ncbi:hypothetical protein KJ780_01895 [Candidatus Micrarchaeota archaeon]|nr:hypothetical protein [Candidatus Micrarchaeota archaeon]
MHETFSIKGRARSSLQKLKEKFEGLGFSSVQSTKTQLTVERVESAGLKGKVHHFYCVTFKPDSVSITYSPGQNKLARKLEAFTNLLNALRLAGSAFEVKAENFHQALLPLLSDLHGTVDSQSFATTQQFMDLSKKHESLERKYKDLALSSETNARILIECEKKRDEYRQKINELEGMSNEILRQELFTWLKTHDGEIDIRGFAKSFKIPTKRVEDGLEYLLKHGYLRQIQ